VLLIRHGASTPAIPGRRFPLTDGHGDPALSEAGVEQAARIAARLALDPPVALFTSGLRRTVETAGPLARASGLEPVEIPDLREIRLGEWEGGEFRVRMANRDPIAARALAEERWDVIPGAEDMEGFGRRVRAGVERIVARIGPGVAAAFVHGAVIGELCRQATASRPFAFIHADNGSLTRLVVMADGRWLLRSFNDTAHLA
jgi:2,3-bisphosphoglycerate-dependent phosphoglycerate mutase